MCYQLNLRSKSLPYFVCTPLFLSIISLASLAEELGPAGYALKFSNNQWATYTSEESETRPNQFTTEAWVCRDLYTSGQDWWQVVINRDNQSPNLTIGTNGFFQFELATVNGFQALETQPGSVPLGQWVHVAETWGGYIMKSYVNGILQTTAMQAGNLPEVTRLFNIGAVDESRTEGFNGLIDEVRIWDVARTEEQILTYYRVPLDGNEPGLVAYWNFDETSGVYALDQSGHSHDLKFGGNTGSAVNYPERVISTIPGFTILHDELIIAESVYGCSESLNLELHNLEEAGNLQAEISLFSSIGDHEHPILLELSSQSGVFSATFPIEQGISSRDDGILQIANGSIISATYLNTNHSSGNTEILSATADVVCNIPTRTPTLTKTPTLSLTPTDTTTDTPTITQTPTATFTPTFTITSTPTPTKTQVTPMTPDIPEGISGYALYFNGNDWAQSEPIPALEETSFSQITVEAWIRPTKPVAGYSTLLSIPGFLQIDLRMNTLVVILTTSTGQHELATATNAFPNDTWHHFSTTWDGKSARIYRDGLQVRDIQKSGTAVPGSSVLVLGSPVARYVLQSGYMANVVVDELRIWSVARTKEEIQSDMKTELQGDENGLLLYWPFNEGSGYVAFDKTSHSVPLWWSQGKPEYVPSNTVGKAGYSLFLDGATWAVSDEYSIFSAESRKSFTVEAWIKPYYPITLSGAPVMAANYHYGFRVTPDWTIYLGLPTDAFYPSDYIDYGVLGPAPGSIQPGQWNHIAESWNGYALSLCINGTWMCGALTSKTLYNPTTRIYVGVSAAMTNCYYGEVDEIRIWSTWRSPVEIQRTMNTPLSGDEPGLIAYWTFDEGPSQYAPDYGPLNIPLRWASPDTSTASNPVWVTSSIWDNAPITPHKGELFFEQQEYPCSGSVLLTLKDSDLQGQQTQILQVQTLPGDKENFTLTEKPSNSGQFTGKLALSLTNAVYGDGIIRVSDGYILSTSYTDLDDGTGTQQVVMATAEINCGYGAATSTPTPSGTNTRTLTPTETTTPTTTLTHQPAAQIVYVAHDAQGTADGSSWENAFQSISTALGYSNSGDQIWVKQGLYDESITLKAGVEVYGGLKGTESETDFNTRDWTLNETVIDAGRNGNSTVTGSDNALLDGFTLTGAFGTAAAGVICGGVSPDIRNCKIINNTSISLSAQSCTSYEEGWEIITYCSCKRGYGGDGAGILLGNSAAVFENCIISGNSSQDSGGGLFMGPIWKIDPAYCGDKSSEESPLNSENADSDDMGNATEEMEVATTERVSADAPQTLFINCLFSGNTTGSWESYGGAFYIQDNNARFVRCRFSDNEAYYASAGYTKNSIASFENCLFSRNQPTYYGIELAHFTSTVNYINSTRYGNNTQEILAYESDMKLTNCILQGSILNGNMTAQACYWDDPRFVDPTGGDFHLQANSACIDNGIQVDLSEDLDGNPRPVDVPDIGLDGTGQGFDIGAFEYQIPSPPTEVPTPSPTDTPVPPILPTDTPTLWPTETETVSATPTFLPTMTETPLPTGTPTVTPSLTLLPTDTPYSADIDENNKVDTSDLLRMLGVWNSEVQSASPEDLNDDTQLDMEDLLIFAEQWQAATGVE